jgi:hypothetical protein
MLFTPMRFGSSPSPPFCLFCFGNNTGHDVEVRTTNDGGFRMSQSSPHKNAPIWLSEEHNFRQDVRDYDGRDSDLGNSNNVTVGSHGLLRAKQPPPRASRNKSLHSHQTPENGGGGEYDFDPQQHIEENYAVGGARGVANLRRHRS